jgi:hypothetical protein
MMRKEEKKEVLVGINLTWKSILLGKHTVAQVHMPSGNIKEGMGWTGYREK